MLPAASSYQLLPVVGVVVCTSLATLLSISHHLPTSLYISPAFPAPVQVIFSAWSKVATTSPSLSTTYAVTGAPPWSSTMANMELEKKHNRLKQSTKIQQLYASWLVVFISVWHGELSCTASYVQSTLATNSYLSDLGQCKQSCFF